MMQPLPPAGPRPSEDDWIYAQEPLAPKSTGKKIAGVVVACLLIALFGLRAYARMEARNNNPTTAPTFTADNLQVTLPKAQWPGLAPGYCVSTLIEPGSGQASFSVGCDEQHYGEVFAILPIAGTDYPGDSSLEAKGNECRGMLGAYADPKKVKKMDVFYLAPSTMTWQFGDHAISCVVGSEIVQTTGSVQKP